MFEKIVAKLSESGEFLDDENTIDEEIDDLLDEGCKKEESDEECDDDDEDCEKSKGKESAKEKMARLRSMKKGSKKSDKDDDDEEENEDDDDEEEESPKDESMFITSSYDLEIANDPEVNGFMNEGCLLGEEADDDDEDGDSDDEDLDEGCVGPMTECLLYSLMEDGELMNLNEARTDDGHFIIKELNMEKSAVAVAKKLPMIKKNLRDGWKIATSITPGMKDWAETFRQHQSKINTMELKKIGGVIVLVFYGARGLIAKTGFIVTIGPQYGGTDLHASGIDTLAGKGRDRKEKLQGSFKEKLEIAFKGWAIGLK